TNQEKIFNEVTESIWEESMRIDRIIRSNPSLSTEARNKLYESDPTRLTPFQPALNLLREMFRCYESCSEEIGLTCLLLYAKAELPKLLKEIQIDDAPVVVRLNKSVPMLAQTKKNEESMTKSATLPQAEKKQSLSPSKTTQRS